MRENKKNFKAGFNLSEILVSLCIIGIGIGLFYSIFLTNWFSYEVELTRLSFQEQAGRVFPVLIQDVMTADSFTIANPQNFTLTYPGILGRPDVTYSINGSGQLSRTMVSAGTIILADQLDPVNSFFQDAGGGFSLLCTLTFSGDVFTKPVDFTASKEITRRNQI